MTLLLLLILLNGLKSRQGRELRCTFWLFVVARTEFGLFVLEALGLARFGSRSLSLRCRLSCGSALRLFQQVIE